MQALDRAGRRFPGAYYDPDVLRALGRSTLFEHVRRKIGFDLFLLHDIHERLAPIDAIRMAKALEPYRLFFLEDPLAPDQIEWFRRLREQCATPIAMGELHNNPLEWRPLIAEQLIDFIRAHISQIGGITPARKLAALCEVVRRAHRLARPGRRLADRPRRQPAPRPGLPQLWHPGSDPLRRAAEGSLPRHARAARRLSCGRTTSPALGVDIDEQKAAKYPISIPPIQWTQSRWPDGTIWTP